MNRALLGVPLLAGLSPIGLGGPGVESLSSFFLRLAETHYVLPRDLARRVVAPSLLGPKRASAPNQLTQFTRVLGRESSIMNGLDGVARQWASTLTELTGDGSLDLLTLLPWEGQLSRWGLMAHTRQYCPACYWEWDQAKAPCRELLIWTLADLKVCPYHRIPLFDRCHQPTCGRMQPHLSTIGRPGQCFLCDKPLALDPESLASQVRLEADPQEAQWATFIGEQLGAMLENSRRARGALLPPVTTTIRTLIDRSGGNQAFAAATGFSPPMVSAWRHHMPALRHLMRVSASLQLPLVDLLIGDVSRRFNQSVAVPASSAGTRPHQRHDWERVEHELERAMTADLVVPQRALLAGLGVDPSSTRKRFPHLCQALNRRVAAAKRERAREREAQLIANVRSIVFDLHANGFYPSRTAVDARLSGTASLREPRLAEAWRVAKSELND